jgi:hypothetical protein
MDDPRNIFVSQRQGYQPASQPTGQNQQPPNQGGAQTSAGNPTAGSNPNDAPKSTATQSDYASKVAEMKRLAEKYQREGEGQLVKDILNTVIEQKAKGQLTNEQLVTFAKRVSPMLNADQRERLNQLVEQLIKL